MYSVWHQSLQSMFSEYGKQTQSPDDFLDQNRLSTFTHFDSYPA